MTTYRFNKTEEKLIVSALRTSWASKMRAANSVIKHSPSMAQKMLDECSIITGILDKIEIDSDDPTHTS